MFLGDLQRQRAIIFTRTKRGANQVAQKLERDGEATSAEVAGDSRPAQRVYTISATGLTALKDWLSVQHSPSAQRSTFLVQIYFSRLNSRENVAALLNAERLRQEAMLHMTESIDLDPKQAGTEQLREQYEFGNLLVDYGRRRARMEIDWLEAALKKMKQSRG